MESFSLKEKTFFNDFLNNPEIKSLSLQRNQIQIHDTEPEWLVDPNKSSPIPPEHAVRSHLEYLQKKIYKIQNMDVKPYTFSDVVAFFGSVQSKSMNKKIFFKKHDKYYMVKKFFTMGVEYVRENENHFYKVEGKPLDIWKLRSHHSFNPNSFNAAYETAFEQMRINSDEEVCLPPYTCYIVIAPYHTFFTKITNSNYSDRSLTPIAIDTRPKTNETNPGSSYPVNVKVESFLNGSGHSNNMDQDRSGDISDSSIATEPGIYYNRKHKMELNARDKGRNKQLVLAEVHQNETLSSTYGQHQEVTNPSLPNNQQLVLNESTDLQARSADRVSISGVEESEMAHGPRNLQPGIPQRAVFGIRKDDRIESYCLVPDSSFQVEASGLLSGSFIVENMDMDPYRFQYAVIGKCIVERAYFKNDSTQETPLLIKKELLELLQEPGKRKEKTVVTYFFDSVFKKVEATYKKFLAMKNTGMIGSCVPAIVQMEGSRFTGSLPDAYQNT